jgi:hypothetical protein
MHGIDGVVDVERDAAQHLAKDRTVKRHLTPR